ncbi:MAG: hypothetical protein DRJ15_13260 [Bacteroidetes bacterium]|nr:MAG: hypothetical protein DRJ15_13260 [Bacteroidota bacterium]
MDYKQITDTILAYSDRKDAGVINNLDNFLTVVESRINRKLKTQKQAMRTRMLVKEGEAYYGLPSDFAGLRDIEIKDDNTTTFHKTMEYATPAQMNDLSGGGRYDDIETTYYTIVANQLQIYPVNPNSVLEIVYYQAIAPLTSDTPSNWVATAFPDIYIFGGMVEISAFIKDAEAAMLWDKRFVEVIREIIDDDKDTRWSGPPMRIR